jgi:DNA processing protein
MESGHNRERTLPTTPGMAALHPEFSSMQKVLALEPTYPARLRELAPPPAVLWFVGRLPPAGTPTIAIVGSRSATGAGCARSHDWAAAVARRGWAVVSGGAFGIDAAAHSGALEGGGQTFAVLGCGVDVVYPDRHAPLFAQIAAGGGLLSELPPGTPPRARQFPSRNRIVAALADVVLVVEAAARSGALITAGVARRRGQRLLAVSGTPGADALIAGGAQAVSSVATLFDALDGRATVAPAQAIPPRQAALITALRAGSDSPGGLARRLGLSLAHVMSVLTEAELDGRVRRTHGSQYEVLRGD